MVCFSCRFDRLTRRIDENKKEFYIPYVAVVHFTDQNWITKTVDCIRCMMVCEIGFTIWNAKIALMRASMVVTYYIKLFRTGTDRHNSILMSLLLLVTETKSIDKFLLHNFLINKPATCMTLKKPSRQSTKGNGGEWEMGNGLQHAR